LKGKAARLFDQKWKRAADGCAFDKWDGTKSARAAAAIGNF